MEKTETTALEQTTIDDFPRRTYEKMRYVDTDRQPRQQHRLCQHAGNRSCGIALQPGSVIGRSGGFLCDC